MGEFLEPLEDVAPTLKGFLKQGIVASEIFTKTKL
jgi:hypothetical protein